MMRADPASKDEWEDDPEERWDPNLRIFHLLAVLAFAGVAVPRTHAWLKDYSPLRHPEAVAKDLPEWVPQRLKDLAQRGLPRAD